MQPVTEPRASASGGVSPATAFLQIPLVTRSLWILLLTVGACLGQQFTIARDGEAVADLSLRTSGAEWATATVRIDGAREQHVIVWAGPVRHTYRVFLGRVAAGAHRLSISGEGVEAGAIRVTATDDPVVAQAPVLYARKNTIGRFSDVPLLMYAEPDGDALVYTVVFSNEDGGTSTRALMARWGRTTDIEYVYRVSAGGAIVQGKDHIDRPFDGKYEDRHPLLMPITDNNMIGAAEDSPLRFQLAPVQVDLSASSREAVMDSEPLTYAVMAKELEREGKLRPFGTVEGENISDVRNYAFFEYRATHKQSAMTVQVALRDGRVFASDLGRIDYAISRDAWVRTTVELPPATKPDDISTVGFHCIVAPPTKRGDAMPHSGTCELQRVSKMFFLDEQYRPGKSLLRMEKPVTLPAGHAILLKP